MAIYLGFDTSNYKTSAALFDSQTGKAWGESRFLQVPEGSLGLRQSEALFQHVRSLGQITESLFEKTGRLPLAAVGYSARPRNQEGSYMPCFLAGEVAARTAAAAGGMPAFAFSHQQGHIASALWSANCLDWMKRPFLSWHLSGGTTELLRVESRPGELLEVRVIGGTQDASAGQIIDRAGVAMGLPFPCGAHLDKLAGEEKPAEKPFAAKMQGLFFSLSGLENKFKALLDKGCPKEQVAAFVTQSIAETVYRVTKKAQKEEGLPVLFSGGVSASSQLQRRFEGKDQVAFAQNGWGGDNALGAALLAAMWKEGVL